MYPQKEQSVANYDPYPLSNRRYHQANSENIVVNVKTDLAFM